MQPHDIHIPDRDLLLDADGELSATRSREIRTHLTNCWSCRARKAAIERTIGEFIEGHYRSFEDQLPPVEGSRAMLLARLGEAAASAPPDPWHRRLLRLLPPPRLAVPALALIAIGVAAGIGGWRNSQQSEKGFTPQAALTPGATRPVSRETVCSSTEEAELRKVATSVAEEVFRQYGIHHPQPRMYEVDYLIPPDLGGSEDPRNLWPQPYSTGVWNARVKDALEDRLRAMVCEGDLDLATAQRDLARDWIAAYKKYFRTERPLLGHIAFVKDRPWE